MARVLVAYHSMGGNTEKIARAVAEGAGGVEGVEVVLKSAIEVNTEDFKSADGFALGTPDYFSYMAGMLKDMFDRVFYEVKSHTEGKPCVCFLTHGGGGRAMESLVKLSGSVKMKEAAEAVSVKGAPSGEDEERCRELGRKLAAAAG